MIFRVLYITSVLSLVFFLSEIDLKLNYKKPNWNIIFDDY